MFPRPEGKKEDVIYLKHLYLQCGDCLLHYLIFPYFYLFLSAHFRKKYFIACWIDL